MLYSIVLFVFVIICLLLVGIILLQTSQSGGMGSIGGGNTFLDGALGSQGADSLLLKTTTVLAVIFMSLAILINLINNRLNIKEENIYDIYGFTEQLGTIYPSSGNGGSKVSSYSHVLVRDPITLKVLNNSETGFLQFISPLPLSYPGFSILNDDLGKISTSNTDKNNNEILEFTINPRLDNAENRGCGDTLPDNYYV